MPLGSRATAVRPGSRTPDSCDDSNTEHRTPNTENFFRMETSLHRQLKSLYGGVETQQEVWVDGVRIDVIGKRNRLVEIQASPLAAIRKKVRTLLVNHSVLVVKPLAARKYLVNRACAGGEIESSRLSPSRQTLYHVFHELVHFIDVFPHPRLTIEVLLIEVEEHRLPATRRWRRKTYRVEDRLLRCVSKRISLKKPADLRRMLPAELKAVFSTEELALAAAIPRWLAQKMAYCLRKTGVIAPVGKLGNAILYSRAAPRKKAA